MVIGRAAEISRLGELLEGVRGGTGHTVVLHGSAGIGKTTLLDALVERCGDDVTVLRARGIEAEAELAFATLADLLGPVLHDLPVLPAPQSAALAGALALGPPAPGERFAVCLATLGLLQAAARCRTVVVIVDDLQWLDAASRECILYAARRAGGSLAFVLAVRGAAGLDIDGVTLRVGPLDRDASRQLLARAAPDLGPAVARAVEQAAEGNPLALVELPLTLTSEQRAGAVPLDVPLEPGRRLYGAFAGRIAEMGSPARRALLVAATHSGDDLATITAACAEAGTSAERLTEAEERALIRIGNGRMEFGHPIVRGAVYHAASPGERRGAHRSLAAVVHTDQRAWHLAAATVGVDEGVAAALEQVGRKAAERRGFAAAAAALERAARLSPSPAVAARRLLAAGEAAAAAGERERALRLLERAGKAADPQVHGRAQQARGRLMVWSGSPLRARALLVAASERVAATDAPLGAAMLADAANACTVSNDFIGAEALAERALALHGEGDTLARAPLLAMLGWARLLGGRAPQARPLLDEADSLARGVDPLGLHGPWQHLLLLAQLPLGELERARAQSEALSRRAREAGALASLAPTLIVLAEAAFRLGDWPAAETAAREAVAVAAESRQHSWHGYALTLLTRLAGAAGRAEEGRNAARTAALLVTAQKIPSGVRFVHGALGFLELSAERTDAAITELEVVERLAEGSGHADPTLVPWLPDLLEARVRAGHTEAARGMLRTVERQAESSGMAFAEVVAGRSRGLLVDDFEPAFASALAAEARRPMPFERARTLLMLGQRLHRVRRRAEARERLREALTGFQALGAAAWAAQAVKELRAAGARRSTERSDRLSPQELRVVGAVRRGGSNREIAAELFLTPKTIEFHLTQIYRKLGVRSRTQLVATLAAIAPEQVEAE